MRPRRVFEIVLVCLFGAAIIAFITFFGHFFAFPI